MAISDNNIPRIDTPGNESLSKVNTSKPVFTQAKPEMRGGTQAKPTMVTKAINNLRSTIGGSDSLAWYWLVLIVLAIAALSYGGWRLYKKYKK